MSGDKAGTRPIIQDSWSPSPHRTHCFHTENEGAWQLQENLSQSEGRCQKAARQRAMDLFLVKLLEQARESWVGKRPGCLEMSSVKTKAKFSSWKSVKLWRNRPVKMPSMSHEPPSDVSPVTGADSVPTTVDGSPPCTPGVPGSSGAHGSREPLCLMFRIFP